MLVADVMRPLTDLTTDLPPPESLFTVLVNDDDRATWEVPDHVRRRMSRTKGRDTGPELVVRRLLHARGHRYRVNHQPLDDRRRTVDIAFTRSRVAVMIDGCFWHACPEHYRPSTTRAEFWAAKIQENVTRDADTNDRLHDAGWTVLRFWEHESPSRVVLAIEAALNLRELTHDP